MALSSIFPMTVSFVKKFISNKIKPSYTITLHGFCLVLNCKMVLRTKEDLSIHHYNEKKTLEGFHNINSSPFHDPSKHGHSAPCSKSISYGSASPPNTFKMSVNKGHNIVKSAVDLPLLPLFVYFLFTRPLPCVIFVVRR